MRRASSRLHMVPTSSMSRSQASESDTSSSSILSRYLVWWLLDFLLIVGILVALILFNNQSKILTKEIIDLRKEIRAGEELKDKLEVERAWMVSTAKLREKAEKLGMRAALKGQIRSR